MTIGANQEHPVAEHSRHLQSLEDRVQKVAKAIDSAEAQMAAMSALAGRVPDKLGETLVRFEMTLNATADRVQEIELLLKSEFVKQNEFWPVRVLVYGFAGLLFTGVVTALLALVIRRGGL